MSENGSPLNRERDPPSPVQFVAPAPDPAREVIRCPHCGGTRISRQTTPLVLNAMACAVTIALTPLFCSMVLAAMVSLAVLPLTASMAIVGRRHCRDCRRRFEPDEPWQGPTAPPRFPFTVYFLDIALLFLLCVIGPALMRAKASAGRLPDVMASVGAFMIFGFLVSCSLACHAKAFNRLQGRVANPRLWGLLFLLPGLLAGGLVFHADSPRSRVQALLKYAELAPLPRSATGLKYYSWSSPFSGEDFVQFTAEPNDIERFVTQSPALCDQQPEHYSARRMRLKHLTNDQGHLIFQSDANEYFIPRRSAPSWYKQEIRGPARKYFIQPPRYQLPGEVLVDDETHTVYIHLWFS